MTNVVKQLRLVVETEDFEAALAFYRDVPGQQITAFQELG